MKNSKHLLIILAPVFAGSSVSYSQICEGKQVVLIGDGNCDYNPWVLAFEENFDGDNLNSSRWRNDYPWGKTLVGNEQEYYSDNNFEIDGGTLKLITKKENVYEKAIPYLSDSEILDDGVSNKRWFNYTSGMIFSKKLFGYGKYEIRCKIPKGKGFWPAFWTFGGSRWNEIDVFEFWNEDNIWGNYDPGKLSKIPHFNAHYDYDGDGNSENCGTKYNGIDYSQSFHTFTMIWDSYKIEWYIDGNLRRRSTKFYTTLGQQIDCNSIRAWHPYIMDKAFPREEFQHIIANLAIQSGSNSPDENTPFPSSFEIDYIRYYKKVPCDIIIANSTNDLNMNDDVFNVVIGTSITLGGNVPIQNGQQLELIARDRITLNPGFTADNGSDFIARIDPSVCSGSFKMARASDEGVADNETSSIPAPSLNTKKEPTAKDQLVDKVNPSEFDSDVKVYPNPTNDILHLEIRSSAIEEYTVVLSDMKGRVLFDRKNMNDNAFDLDMTHYPSGVYVLQIVDVASKKSYFNKVIKEQRIK